MICHSISRTFSSVHVTALALYCIAPLMAQTIPEGYAHLAVALPTGASSVAVVAQGTVWFDGTKLILDAPGQPPQTLLQFGTPRFGAFTRAVEGGQSLLFGESSFGELWLVPLSGSPPQLVVTLNLPYDAAPLGPSRAIVSAKTRGFAASDNDLIAVDLHTGSTVVIATIPGASGPLLVSDSGDIVYATAPLAFPPPPGSVEILQFDATQWARPLTGGPVLGIGEARSLFHGICTASHLALDADDDLLFVDWLNGTVGEINDLHDAAWRSVLVDYANATLSPTGMVLLPSVALQFEPFARQPGATLFIHESDFFSTDQLRSIETLAAELITPGGPIATGPFSVTLQQAATGGLAVLAVNATSAGIAVPVHVPGIEQLLHWDAAMFHPINTYWANIDGQGQASVLLTNPGVAAGFELHLQAAFLSLSPGACVAGTTAASSVLLGV